MNRKILIIAGTVFLASITFLIARSFRPAEIPNGDVNRCSNCHLNPAGGGARNVFGQEVENNFLSTPGAAGHVQWGPSLAAIDSDGDGFTNGEELQDPNGTWKPGDPAPGDPSLVTLPGDSTSHPSPTAVARAGKMPEQIELIGNYPNPFNPQTRIQFKLVKVQNISLIIFNERGQQVRKLAQDTFAKGTHDILWDGKNDAGQFVNSGLYFYRFHADGFSRSARMLLLK